MITKEYKKVLDKIIAEIKSGMYSIGDKLPSEREIATELSISRNSTREAIRMLENMGIIECRQGSGNYISGDMSQSLSVMLDLMLSLEQFDKKELFRFRMNLEKVICSMLLEHPDTLQDVADKADALLAQPAPTPESKQEIDRQFHFLLAEATGNRLLILLVKSAATIFAEMINSIHRVSDAPTLEKVFQAHKNIIVALRSGNRDSCDRAIEKHYKLVDEIAQQAKLEEYLESRVYNQLDIIDEKQEKDALTGLFNKEVFFQKVEEYITQHPDEELLLWSSDIQGLRFVNEEYGMETGDRVICSVADRGPAINGYLFGGRIGGDKFCMLLKDTHVDFESINKMLIEELDPKLPVENLTVKNGIYHIKQNDTHSAHAMYVRSVLALQSIKNSYSTMIVEYDESMRKRLLDSRQIESDAKRALKNQEFCVYLQPKIDLTTNAVAGAEALVRWIHPELGFMSPGVFLPIFEKDGFITKLDMWIWEDVCKTLTEWKKNHLPIVPISVNVSKNSFEDPNLAEKIIALVDRYELDHSLLEIEITEYSCLDNIERIQNTIQTLHDAGFVISLDDFGTGYSSMVVLSKIEIDIMKLDMSLIRNDDSNAKRSALEFALQLAEMMQLKTVAEGIETEQQVERIRSLGGDYIQGYFYSKPLPKKEFEEYLSLHK